MNITIPPLRFKNNQVNYNNNDNNYTPKVQPYMQGPLKADTVSFAAEVRRATQPMKEILENSYEKASPRLNRIATAYMDGLESIAHSLQSKGRDVIFDRGYCEPHCVKSAAASAGKVVRNKTISIPDQVRATLYVKNPYDLSILINDILPEFKKRGYVLSTVEKSVEELEKRRFKWEGLTDEMQTWSIEKKRETMLSVPDLDIRLDSDNTDFSALPDKLKFALSNPQKSGYEDIQLRLVREFDKTNNPVQHELIILFGSEYGEAKHLEWERLYTPLRQFGELNIAKKLKTAILGTSEAKAQRYIEIIETVARSNFSKKLFENGKNKAAYGINEAMPLSFSERDAELFKTYFSVLKDRITDSYNYMKIANPEDKRRLAKELRQDKELINKIQEELNVNFKYLLDKYGDGQ